MIDRHIPRAAWPDVKAMFIDQMMTKQAIAVHYATTIGAVTSALRGMGCTLSPEEVTARSKARIEAVNAMRALEPAEVKPTPPFSIMGVILAASKVTSVSVLDLCGPRKFAKLVRIRAAIYYVARPYYSFPHIGRIVGGRDHSTVINGLTIAERYMAKDWRFHSLVESIRNQASHTARNERRAITAQVERLAA